MSQNASRRGVREFLSSKCRRFRNRLDPSVQAFNNSLSDQCVLPSVQEAPSSISRTAAASSLDIIPALPQAKNNEVLYQMQGQEDSEKSCSGELPQQVDASISGIADHSLWAMAYEDLRVTNPELVERFNDCLGISTVSDKVKGESANPSIERIVQKALQELEQAKNAKEHLDKTSPVRKCFEQTIKVVSASKDYISSVVSVNPYAALAWTGISLLLPLLLNPTKENEAAIRGLDYVANLIVVYRWQEKIYLHDDDSPDFKKKAGRLYTKILEFEATLLIHMQQNLPRRWVRNVFQAGEWKSQVEDMKSYDADCRVVTNAIQAVRTNKWREEERMWQDKLLQMPRQEEENRHIRMLYSNYEAGKNVNPERIPGTCEWLLNHADFLTWRESQTSNLLWLSADPGCGKSVLSKHLVDRKGEVLTVNTETPTICYFFFKDGDVDRTDGAKAICAFLHQLILQQPHLYQYAKEDFQRKSEVFLTDFNALWAIFLKATANGSGREIICVLDALDECHEDSRKAVIAKLIQLYGCPSSSKVRKPILKFLVTSRAEFTIVRDFRDVSEVRLHGEQESEQIKGEIELVIRAKVESLGSKMDLNESDKSNLRENLSKIPHRTYLWLHLTFDTIEKQLELTKDDIASIARSIPQNVDQAYTAILDKSPDRERARKLLHIVLAAATPLTVQETNVAMVMDERYKSHKDFDIWRADVSEDKIKNICGLFLSVVDSRVYLIHQTAREFLVCEESAHSSSALQASSIGGWKRSFYPSQSNLLMAKICVNYLHLMGCKGERHLLDADCILYDYVVGYWALHFTQAKNLPESALIEKVADNLCNIDPRYSLFWLSISWNLVRPRGSPRPFNIVLLESFWGHDTVLKLLLQRNDVMADRKDHDGRTPLWWAAHKGHEAVVRLLLEREDVQADSKDKKGRTPLQEATVLGHEEVVRLLLERKDVQADFRDAYSRSVLSMAVAGGHEVIVQLLLERDDVDANSRDKYGRTPISLAAEYRHQAIVMLLLARDDVQVASQDSEGRTPLSFAAERGHETVVKLLLEWEDIKGDTDHQEPLEQAVCWLHEAVVKLLLARGNIKVDDHLLDKAKSMGRGIREQAMVKLPESYLQREKAMVRLLESYLHRHPRLVL